MEGPEAEAEAEKDPEHREEEGRPELQGGPWAEGVADQHQAGMGRVEPQKRLGPDLEVVDERENEGKPGEGSRQNGFYFGEPKEFVKILEDWRADGEMKGLERS